MIIEETLVVSFLPRAVLEGPSQFCVVAQPKELGCGEV